MQKNGIEVIPNVRWGKEETYDFCFDGIPRGGTVAMGTNGCMSNNILRYYFKKGLKELIGRIAPKTIIVYGTMPKNIFEEYLEKISFINIPHWKQILCKARRCD